MSSRPPLAASFLPVVAMLAAIALASPAAAQRADTARVGVKPRTDTTARSAPKPPLSPRRAFLYSFLLPGYSQSVLGRPTAGALFVLTESIGIAMLRESRAELDQARRLGHDSSLVIGRDPLTGTDVTLVSSFNEGLISTRRRNVEDWVAFLIANHLFAGIDGFVAAHLWDLPTQVSVRQTESGTVVAGRLRW